jgi:2-dehydropantoate 2-reductase
MTEAQQIGARIGCPIEESPEDRNRVTRELGAFKSSMLQDAEAGRGLELDTLVGAEDHTVLVDAVLAGYGR